MSIKDRYLDLCPYSSHQKPRRHSEKITVTEQNVSTTIVSMAKICLSKPVLISHFGNGNGFGYLLFLKRLLTKIAKIVAVTTKNHRVLVMYPFILKCTQSSLHHRALLHWTPPRWVKYWFCMSWISIAPQTHCILVMAPSAGTFDNKAIYHDATLL